MTDLEYTNYEKYLVQIMLRDRQFSEKKLTEIHKKIFKERKVTLDDTIKLINLKISKSNLKVEKIICEMSGNTMYVLYPTVKPKFSMLNVTLSLSEKEFMSLVFQGIITSMDGSITTSKALNYANSLKNKGLKLIDAEKLVEDFISQKALMYTNSKETNISFTPLTILELEHEFRESFGDYISDCSLCKRTIFYGKVCDNCNIKIHFHCLKSFSSKSGNIRCPSCKSPVAATSN